jgi:hypothetical protein
MKHTNAHLPSALPPFTSLYGQSRFLIRPQLLTRSHSFP